VARLRESCSRRGADRSDGWRRRFPLAALSLSLAAGCASSVPKPDGWAGPFDARSVLDRAVAAAGGPAAIDLPERVRSRSRVVLHRPDGAPLHGELEYAAEGSARERRELVTEDHHRLLQVIDGARSLELEDGVPTGRDLADEARVRTRYRRLLADLSEADPVLVALVAEPAADSKREIVVEGRFQAGERWQLWLDATTLLSRRIRRITNERDATHVDEDLLSDHARAGARVIPRHQVTRRDERLLKEAWLLEYEEGVALEPDSFQVDPRE